MWIDYIYFYVATWGALGRFSGYSLDRSNLRLKRMPKNRAGVSLLHDKLDDKLRRHGWDPLS